MAGLRHIAIMVTDPEESARFFEAAFGMTRVGEHNCGFHLSDGVMNVSVLLKEFDHEVLGIDHFGIVVDDLDEATARALAAGAEIVDEKPESDEAALELKFRSPEGLMFDLSRKGWPGSQNSA
jgi:lactoylglutathione lyase